MTFRYHKTERKILNKTNSFAWVSSTLVAERYIELQKTFQSRFGNEPQSVAKLLRQKVAEEFSISTKVVHRCLREAKINELNSNFPGHTKPK